MKHPSKMTKEDWKEFYPVPYETHDCYACPKCGGVSIIGVEVEHGVYVPECSNCGYQGIAPDFLVVSKENSLKVGSKEVKQK